MNYDLPTPYKRPTKTNPIKRPVPRKDLYLDPKGRLVSFSTSVKKPPYTLGTAAALNLQFSQLVGDEVGLNKEIRKLNTAAEKYVNPIQTLIYERNKRILEYRDILASNYRTHLNRFLNTGITEEEAKHKANIAIKKDVEHYAKQIEDEFPKSKLQEFAEKKQKFNELIGWGATTLTPRLLYENFI